MSKRDEQNHRMVLPYNPTNRRSKEKPYSHPPPKTSIQSLIQDDLDSQFNLGLDFGMSTIPVFKELIDVYFNC